MPFYAVKNGRIPGIYTNWNDCQKNINGFSGAKFHKFLTEEEAEDYLNNEDNPLNYKIIKNTDNDVIKTNEIELHYPLAFVDGSYNPKKNISGYGCILVLNKEENPKEYYKCFDEDDIVKMKNISGEILAARRAIEEAVRIGLNKIHIYYDYTGIELWSNKQWSTKIDLIKNYVNYVDQCRQNGFEIIFHKVSAHVGVDLNERVDLLAKKSVGLL